MEIGRIINQIRLEQDLSWDALEAASGVRRSTMHQWAIGRRNPLSSVEKVLDALGYEIEVVRK